MGLLRNLFIEKKQVFLTIGTIVLIIGIVLGYPTIFKSIYETGRDFGRSIVNIFLS